MAWLSWLSSPRRPFAGWAARIAILVSPLLVSACLITTQGDYFGASDFVQPPELAGIWRSVPLEGTDKSAEVSYMQIKPVDDGRDRATPLLSDGRIDVDNDTVDFGLVDLGGGTYLATTSEPDGDSTKSEYVGLKVEGDKLTFALFDGGVGDAQQMAFAQELTKSDLSRDPAERNDVRLAGAITKDKIKALFADLMADPAQYGGNITVFTKAVGMTVKEPPKTKPRARSRRRRHHH